MLIPAFKDASARGSDPLELFVMGVASEMTAKTQLLSGGARGNQKYI